MTLSIPPRSLPPPAPPKVAAQTRIKALQADLEAQTGATARAALQFEIAALHETQLGERAQALSLYEAAALTDPGFRPPLLAMARMLRESGDYAQLRSVLQALAQGSQRPQDRAAALVELGILLEDQLHDPDGAGRCFEDALAADPGSRAAALMLERKQRREGRIDDAVATLMVRLRATSDPDLAHALAVEIADHYASTERVDEAIATLLASASDPTHRYVTLERVAMLARAHARHAVTARALDDMSELLAAHMRDEDFVGRGCIAARFVDTEACRKALVWQLREVGRLRLLADDAAGAVAAYDRAHDHAPDEVLVSFERLLACEAAGEIDRARELALELMPLADAARAAVLQFHLAELAQSRGDGGAARGHLEAALAADPSSPAVLAVLEDVLIDEGAFETLVDLLRGCALQDDAGRRRQLERAAVIAAGPGNRPELALALYAQLCERHPDDAALLRDMHGVALRSGDHAHIAATTEALLAGGIDDDESSALLWQCYQSKLALGDVVGARTVIESALADSRCARWAPQLGVVIAALQRDHELSVRAHGRMAELATSPERAAAHLCARARASLRQGRPAPAIESLQRALQRVPGHAYAVALLEELLPAQGDATDAVYLLREAATAAIDARRGELALLHAGAMAEAAGSADLAARSYEEATNLDPDAFAPLWLSCRLAERNGVRAAQLSALEALHARAERQENTRASGTEALELGALYDALDRPDLAAAPLRAAMGGDDALDAAVDAMLCASHEVDPTLRQDALRVLEPLTDGEAQLRLLREQAARRIERPDPSADAAMASLATVQRLEAPEHLTTFLTSHHTGERAAALQDLAATFDDAGARADVLLHARRILSHVSADSSGGDALVEALSTFDEAPTSAAAAVALGEALSPSDDADLRARALETRLQHALPEASHNLSLALARAMIEAGRTQEAIQLLNELLERDPDDSCAWEALLVAARARHDDETVVRACDALAAQCEGEWRSLLLEEAATLLEERLGRPNDAETRLRMALAADDARGSVFERLHDLVLERGDFSELASLVAARLGVVTSPEERTDLLYEHARLLRGLGHRDAARACVDELLALAPAHAGGLALAAEIYASQHNWSSAVEALRALGHAEAPAKQRRLARKGAADFLERHMHDLQAAYGELELLGRDGLADLGTWKRMAELAQRAGLFPQAVAALAQASKLSQGHARATLERRMGDLLARDPEQKEAACEAWRRALLAWPSDIDACEALCGASSPEQRTALLTTFTAHVLGLLGKDPDNAPELRALRRAALLASDTTLEHVALCTLATLGLASDEELAARDRLDAAIATAPSEAWSEEHFSALLESTVPESAWRFARIACKAWLDAQRETPQRYGVTRQERMPKGVEHALRSALTAWTSSFGLEVPELYLGGSAARAVTMVLQPGHAQAWILGREVQSPLDKLTRFHVGQQCAAMHVGVLPLLRRDRAAARDILLATWFAAVPSATPDGERLAPASRQLARELSRAQRRDIEECIAALPDPMSALDAVLDGARTLGLRAGMVAACDPDVAISVALGVRLQAGTPASSPQAVALLRFWTSNTLLSLRRELGLHA